MAQTDAEIIAAMQRQIDRLTPLADIGRRVQIAMHEVATAPDDIALTHAAAMLLCTRAKRTGSGDLAVSLALYDRQHKRAGDYLITVQRLEEGMADDLAKAMQEAGAGTGPETVH